MASEAVELRKKSKLLDITKKLEKAEGDLEAVRSKEFKEKEKRIKLTERSIRLESRDLGQELKDSLLDPIRQLTSVIPKPLRILGAMGWRKMMGGGAPGKWTDPGKAREELVEKKKTPKILPFKAPAIPTKTPTLLEGARAEAMGREMSTTGYYKGQIRAATAKIPFAGKLGQAMQKRGGLIGKAGGMLGLEDKDTGAWPVKANITRRYVSRATRFYTMGLRRNRGIWVRLAGMDPSKLNENRLENLAPPAALLGKDKEKDKGWPFLLKALIAKLLWPFIKRFAAPILAALAGITAAIAAVKKFLGIKTKTPPVKSPVTGRSTKWSERPGSRAGTLDIEAEKKRLADLEREAEKKRAQEKEAKRRQAQADKRLKNAATAQARAAAAAEKKAANKALQEAEANRRQAVYEKEQTRKRLAARNRLRTPTGTFAGGDAAASSRKPGWFKKYVIGDPIKPTGWSPQSPEPKIVNKPPVTPPVDAAADKLPDKTPKVEPKSKWAEYGKKAGKLAAWLGWIAAGGMAVWGAVDAHKILDKDPEDIDWKDRLAGAAARLADSATFGVIPEEVLAPALRGMEEQAYQKQLENYKEQIAQGDAKYSSKWTFGSDRFIGDLKQFESQIASAGKGPQIVMKDLYENWGVPQGSYTSGAGTPGIVKTDLSSGQMLAEQRQYMKDNPEATRREAANAIIEKYGLKTKKGDALKVTVVDDPVTEKPESLWSKIKSWIPGLAQGGSIPTGGIALTGEQGPELATSLPLSQMVGFDKYDMDTFRGRRAFYKDASWGDWLTRWGEPGAEQLLKMYHREKEWADEDDSQPDAYYRDEAKKAFLDFVYGITISAKDEMNLRSSERDGHLEHSESMMSWMRQISALGDLTEITTGQIQKWIPDVVAGKLMRSGHMDSKIIENIVEKSYIERMMGSAGKPILEYAKGGKLPMGRFGIVGEAGPELVRGPATIIPLTGKFAGKFADGGTIPSQQIGLVGESGNEIMISGAPRDLQATSTLMAGGPGGGGNAGAVVIQNISPSTVTNTTSSTSATNVSMGRGGSSDPFTSKQRNHGFV